MFSNLLITKRCFSPTWKNKNALLISWHLRFELLQKALLAIKKTKWGINWVVSFIRACARACVCVVKRAMFCVHDVLMLLLAYTKGHIIISICGGTGLTTEVILWRIYQTRNEFKSYMTLAQCSIQVKRHVRALHTFRGDIFWNWLSSYLFSLCVVHSGTIIHTLRCCGYRSLLDSPLDT